MTGHNGNVGSNLAFGLVAFYYGFNTGALHAVD